MRAHVNENSWIHTQGQETASLLADWEVMPSSAGCLLRGCCPLVCEGFIIKLAQALWSNIGGKMSAHKAPLAHYLRKEVKKNSTKMCVLDLLSDFFLKNYLVAVTCAFANLLAIVALS